MGATITMSMSEWQEKQNRIDELERELSETQGHLEEARLDSGEGDARQLAGALGFALEIVQFALANYEPRMYPGWPHEALAAFAELLPDLPGMPVAMREQANDLKLFGRNAAEWEEARANGTQEVKLLEENAGRSLTIPDLGGAARIIKG
jgi:hypothetical protein